jgi:hypothetical protein
VNEFVIGREILSSIKNETWSLNSFSFLGAIAARQQMFDVSAWLVNG